MVCPACQVPSHATDIRCIRCGTTLIYEAEGHSRAFKEGALALDRRMYGGIGGVLGLAVALALINTVLQGFYFDGFAKGLICTGGGAVGSGGGRMAAWWKWRSL